ncbi:DUF6249 domain-containing protein [Hyphobacterium sp. SN044]|uniref:DUF6249 domain-containing protein n=1 Tax=Hyphobacterium sp. SN044 TaxID=2912575 RepID=UPI001F3ADA91|nr:DUF6249 domain-containing protein [Hyphobacterium sp. SN044]MCF8878685.1 DUF6249 domain-containing protein [Hyphobacterium sp. SN044]
MDETLIPITLFLMPVFIVGIVMYFGSRNRAAVLETVRAAAQAGQQLSPETIRALGMPRRNKGGDVRWGIILLAIAIAFSILGWTINAATDEPEAFQIMLGVASFPGLVGLALIAMGVFMKSRNDED